MSAPVFPTRCDGLKAELVLPSLGPTPGTKQHLRKGAELTRYLLSKGAQRRFWSRHEAFELDTRFGKGDCMMVKVLRAKLCSAWSPVCLTVIKTCNSLSEGH